MSKQYVDPRYVAQQYVDPRYVAQQYVDPQYVDLPGPSELSRESLEKSGLSNASAHDSSLVTYLGFGILAIMFILLTGAVTYALVASPGAGGDDSESADDSFGRGSNGFPSGDHGPIMDKDGILIAGGVLRPYGINGRGGHTAPPALEKEKSGKVYICTVGAYAVVPQMYPKDGLCDYLYYTEVAVFNHKVTFTEVELSWTLFQQQAKSLQKTGAGISFDARYVTAVQLQHKAVKAQLNALAANNIKHYGLLNVRGPDAELKTMFSNALLVIEELKGLQSDGSQRMIIAIGVMDYSLPESVNRLNAMFKTAVEKTQADTVIVISSISTMDQELHCYALPPLFTATSFKNRSVFLTKLRYPTLNSTVPFVTDSFPLVKRTTIVGLSMEMAVMTYILWATPSEAADVPFQKCRSAGMASANIICSGNSGKPNEVYLSGLAGVAAAKTGFYAESLDTIAEKVKILKGSRLRKKFAWLLYNVHYTDIEGRCNETGHARVSELKKLFE